MQSILTQCAQLDDEFNLLIPTIEQMVKELSIVSREFVSSKLDFLKKYSESLKFCQIDARQHRNQQTRNLIEYIKMHRQAKIKSITQISSAKKKRKSNTTTSGYFSLQKTNSTIQHSKTLTSEFDNQLIFKPANVDTLKRLILKQKTSQSQVNEQMLRLINKCMNLLQENQQQFPDFNRLDKEYTQIQKSNTNLSQKLNLQIKSEKVKENLKKLMESQESFKSYLNSII